MRMRKKKNLDVRFAACADVMAFEPKEKRGRWRALFGNDHPLHLEIGCGKAGLPSAWQSSIRMSISSRSSGRRAR